jgi:glycosyltransferase involved in cell wall biosynthesis
VLHYLELADRLDRSGIGTSVDHQRRALADTAVELVTTPWQGASPTRALLSAAGGAPPIRDYDLLHCNMIGPASAALVSHARARGRPVVLHSHVTSEDFRGSFRGSGLAARPLRRYLRWFYSRADLVCCPSDYTRRTLRDYPVDAPIRTVTNGVDTAALEGHEALRGTYRDRFDLSGTVVFAVGNVFERKGLSTFCQLARETDHDFVWFGPYDDGPHASRAVRRWTRDPPENVTFTGWIEDIRGAYGAGDIYLFPTKAENQGIAVLEAMACGKAVVLSDIPVFREFYEDGHDCLIRSTRAEFREAVDRLAGDPGLRERLGANARETAREHGLDRVGDRLAETYEAVLAGEPGRLG